MLSRDIAHVQHLLSSLHLRKLISRMTTFLRRELRVWVNMDVEVCSLLLRAIRQANSFVTLAH
jgi:hypothetical protein